ncbi:anti-sigma B factor antagonist [Blastococcus aggregatus]|uniref:Anti-sigma factor antagonist n=1 Tax=Blastococcus aggregatus TaxID=38502 RepID=A0A285V9S7_9ACTN|nr:STAS domain-containing protein [Blastococcus aggregatus]SOC50348.1 anti-sigma B factor antagonist [Blastococcus aggregatus]
MAALFADSSASHLVSIDVVAHGPAVQVTAAGEIDSSSAPVLEQRLEAVLAAELERLTIDLRGVSFLDSAGLCVLAAAHKRAGEKQVALRVLASSRAVIRPLQITGLWQLLGAEQVAAVSDDASVA